MRVLIIGGTGLISTGIVKHLRDRSADITCFNRGKRPSTLPDDIKTIVGDRNDFTAFEREFQSRTFDVVIDMVCFTPEQAHSVARAFKGRCEHFIFCSTVCTYGVKIPPRILVDETFPQEPISGYGRNKVQCEKILAEAHQQKAFALTIIRPSCTYGPGSSLIDHLESNPVSWDRLIKGKPILCGGDGRSLWVATHRDDCGKLFAYGAMNPITYGKSYNATRDQNFTWRDFYADVAAALGVRAQVIYMPSEWIVKHDAPRFGLLHEITQYHGAYDSSLAKCDVPEFKCEIQFKDGASETLADLRRRNAWRNSDNDMVYDAMVQKALAAGVEPVTL